MAPFFKKERQVEATLVGFPDSELSKIKQLPRFTITYFVEEGNIAAEHKEKYKLVLDYNMRDSISRRIVPVLVNYPDFIQDYTIKPSFYRLKHAK